MGEMVTREDMGRSLARGSIGVGTGIVLFILGGLPLIGLLGFKIIPIVVGAIIGAVGLSNLKKQEGSVGGMIALGAGALTIVSGLPFIGGLGGFLLGAGAIGSIVYGVLQFVRFWKGLKSRS